MTKFDKLSNNLSNGLSKVESVIATGVTGSLSDITKKLRNDVNKVVEEKQLDIKALDKTYLDRIKQVNELHKKKTVENERPKAKQAVQEQTNPATITMADKFKQPALLKKLMQSNITKSLSAGQIPNVVANNIVYYLTIKHVLSNGHVIDEKTIKIAASRLTDGHYYLTENDYLSEEGYALASEKIESVKFESAKETITFVYNPVNNKFAVYDHTEDVEAEEIDEEDDFKSDKIITPDEAAQLASQKEDETDDEEPDFDEEIPALKQPETDVENEDNVENEDDVEEEETVDEEEETIEDVEVTVTRTVRVTLDGELLKSIEDFYTFTGLRSDDETLWEVDEQVTKPLETLARYEADYLFDYPAERTITPETESFVEVVELKPIVTEEMTTEERHIKYVDEAGQPISETLTQTRRVITETNHKTGNVSKKIGEFTPAEIEPEFEGYEITEIHDDEFEIVKVYAAVQTETDEEQFDRLLAETVIKHVELPTVSLDDWSYISTNFDEFEPIASSDIPDLSTEASLVMFGSSNLVVGENYKDKFSSYIDLLNRYATRLQTRINNERLNHRLNPILTVSPTREILDLALRFAFSGQVGRDNEVYNKLQPKYTANVNRQTISLIGDGLTPESIADNVFLQLDERMILDADVRFLLGALTIVKEHDKVDKFVDIEQINQKHYDVAIVNWLY